MGTFLHPLTLRRDGKEVTLDALVDTGSTFTSVPGQILHELGVQPIATIRVRLADGRSETADVGELTAQIDDYSPRTIICAFGPADAPAIIGAHTLEAFLLGVDPLSKQLVPVEALWAGKHA